MATTICPDCKNKPVAAGHYMCEACEDRMAGRPPKPPKADKAASSPPLRCGKCGTVLTKDDLFCSSCGSARPRDTTGRASSARTSSDGPTYQDPLFVNGVYRCPKCNAVLEAGLKRCGACGVMFMHPVPQARASAGASADAWGTRPDAAGSGSNSSGACPHCQAPGNPSDQFCAACGSARNSAGASEPPTKETTVPPLQRVMSSAWFHKLWDGAGALWRWGLLALFLFSFWSIGSRVVHYFQGAGMNGVYEASDGFGYVTFWPNGTYQTSGMGLSTTGRYEIEHDGSIDMLAQYKAQLHPGPNASADAQDTALFGSMFASGMETAALSTDKNTLQWFGHTYTYFGKPTTGPPTISDAKTTETTAPSSAAAPSQMHTPTSQEINQSLAKPGDEFHVNTDSDPNVTDPNQIQQQQMQQYNAAHPGMTPTQPVPSTVPSEPVDTSAPQGVVMPDANMQEELKKVN